jgi:hypothetical protein
MVLGARTSATIEHGAMTRTQRFGNWFAPLAMRALTGARYRDMPPFKAVTARALAIAAPADRGHGFTIDLLLAAHARGLRVQEIDVRCRARRGGVSKVSGTVLGSARAAAKILWSIGRHAGRNFLSRRA